MRRIVASLGAGLLLLATVSHAAPAIEPEAVESLPYAAIGEPPPVAAELRIELSPGGAMLAVNDGQTIWLYRRDTHRRFAVSPAVAPATPFNAAAVASLEGMDWDSHGTLHAWVRLYGGSLQAYAADARGAHGPMLQTPDPEPDAHAPLAGRDPIPDPDNAYDIRANARHIVWRQNRGHGSMVLMAASPGGPPRELARGGWELENAPFDAAASRVIHASSAGVMVHPLASGQAQVIAGTRADDQPMSFDAASRWLLVYRPRGGCDAATAQNAAPHACLLRLPAVADTASLPHPAPRAHAQPSFDCAQARSITEHLLCERAPLAALDVELAGLYRQALDRSANPGALKKQQTDWLRERDQTCTADKTLAQAREGLAVDTCLREHYGARIRGLRHQVAPDIHLTRLQGRSANAALPGDALPPRFGNPQGSAAVQALGDEGLIAGTALQLGQHLIWLSDQGRGNVILRAHLQGTPGTLDLQRGSWELAHLLHDDGHLIYPSDDGLMFLDLATGRAHRIRQTAMADLPLTWNPATRLLTWSSPRLCGITEGGNRLGPQLCSAVLDAPRR